MFKRVRAKKNSNKDTILTGDGAAASLVSND